MFKTSIILLLLSIIGLSITYAETPRSGSNNQAQALIQQLGAERTRLTAENAKLKRELKDIKKEIESLKEENTKTEKRADSIQSELNTKSNLADKLTERLSQAKTRMEELIAKFRETIARLKDAETLNQERANEIASLEKEVQTCATNNVALSKLGYEVLNNYENKGFWDRAGQFEAFTQLKKVQIENLVDEYIYLIEDQEYRLPENSQASE